jgi:hypothetical protein
MSYRGKTWQDIAALDEHLTVFLKLDEALERFLEDFGFSSHEAYKISTDSGSVDRLSRAQISAAVDSLGGSLSSLESRYTDPDGGRSVGITTQPFPAFPVYRIACALNVHGDDETETNGRFDTLRNRMDAEIKRQWPKSTARQQETLPPAVSPPGATTPSAGGFKQWLDGASRHPIIAPLVVVGVLALITGLWKLLGG